MSRIKDTVEKFLKDLNSPGFVPPVGKNKGRLIHDSSKGVYRRTRPQVWSKKRGKRFIKVNEATGHRFVVNRKTGKLMSNSPFNKFE